MNPSKYYRDHQGENLEEYIEVFTSYLEDPEISVNYGWKDDHKQHTFHEKIVHKKFESFVCEIVLFLDDEGLAIDANDWKRRAEEYWPRALK